MNKELLGKRIFFLILIIIFMILAVFIYINHCLTPLPEEKRNISTSNIKMLINMEDERTPIIRTYNKEEFDNFNENKIKKIKGIVDGNIEGDIPALRIENGIGILKVSFEKYERSKDLDITTKIIPDDVPKIGISSLSKEINDFFIKDEEEGIYVYEIKGYSDQNRIYHNENDKFFIELLFIEVSYEIDKESYVSIFAINAIENKN